MATKVSTPVEEYLHTTYEHDREYVHGEIVERGMPTKRHARTQTLLIRLFAEVEANHGLYAVSELRNRLGSDLFRIPDVAVYVGEPPEEVPTTPPLIAVEILSPDDRLSRITAKCEEYLRWGVRHIWIADPDDRRIYVFDLNGLHEVREFEVSQFGISITPAQIFA